MRIFPIVGGAALLCVLGTLTQDARASAWTQPKDAFYARIWNRTLVGQQVFITERTAARVDDPYQDHQLHAYAEYGLVDAFTLTLSATGLGFATYGDEQRVYSGGGAVGLRYRLTEGSVTSAVEVQVGGRPASGELGSGTVTFPSGNGTETQAFVATPSIGTAHGSLSISAGYALPFVWMVATAGTRVFTNTTLRPAFFVVPQIGWTTKFGLVFDLHMNWYHSTGGIGPINVYGAGQTRYLALGVGASYWFTDRFAVTAGFDSALYATANAATPALAIGIEFR